MQIRRMVSVIVSVIFFFFIPPVFSQETYNFELMWGSEGTGGGQFNSPVGIALDPTGNIYVADTGNHRIQEFDSNGNFITKWGSEGTGDGQFKFPAGVAVDGSGNVYVSDTENNRIQKFDSGGNLITKWGFPGNPQYYNDGNPQGIAVDSFGNVYVIVYRHAITFTLPPPPVPVTLKFDSNGNFITEWPLWTLGAEGVAVDSSGNVYATVGDDSYSSILKFGPEGNFFTKWGSLGQGQGQFDHPGGVAIDPSGNVYVADTYNHRIQKFSPTGQELVSAPNTPAGPIHGVPGVSYTYSTGGSVSSLGHPVEYRFYWGDGTYSDWSSTPAASRTWSSPGDYQVKAQARCAMDISVVSYWSAVNNVDISRIDLLSPPEHTHFGACFLYSPVTFSWNASDSFVGYEIHFSGMTSIPIKVLASSTEIVIPSKTWRQIMMSSGPSGVGTIYWSVIGTRSDGTTETSNARVFLIVSQPPGNPNISPTGKRSKPILTWQNNCNAKFNVWFGSDTSFTKKRTFTFNVKDPTVEDFSKTLNPIQWMAIKSLVKNATGSTIYWEVYSWDAVGRHAKTEVMSFTLMD